MKTVHILLNGNAITVTGTPAAIDDLLTRSRQPDWSIERYGEWCDDWYESPFRVAGVTEGCFQMGASAAFRREQAWLRRTADGCCGELRSDGFCMGCAGVCPVWEKCQDLFKQMGVQ